MKLIQSIKTKYAKYGLLLGTIWLVGLVVLGTISFIYGGIPLLTAYLMCKFSGVCPI